MNYETPQFNGHLFFVFLPFLDWLRDKTVQAREFVAEKTIARKAILDELEMRDKNTGEIYCVRIAGGEWERTKGECGAEIIPGITPVVLEPAMVSESPSVAAPISGSEPVAPAVESIPTVEPAQESSSEVLEDSSVVVQE